MRRPASVVCYEEKDRKHEGGQVLATIYEWFTERFDSADLKDAAALLDELSAQSVRSALRLTDHLLPKTRIDEPFSEKFDSSLVLVGALP